MKKLIIAAAILTCAFIARAESANWSFFLTQVYDGNSTTTVDGLTAYVFDATSYDMASIYSTWKGGTSISGSALSSASVANGVVANTPFSAFEQGSGSHSFFVAIVDGSDKIYFSQTLSKAAGSTSTAVPLTFGSQSAGSQQAALQTGVPESSRWISSQVPEPTSGMLMLLGFAGLALKRKAKKA